KGDAVGLQTGAWTFAQIDIVCDLLDIPEDRQFDTVLCTEVLEHVPDPVAALAKLARLVRPGGQVIVTAPFNSLTHFAPYHYATGLSRYFYEWHLPRLGLTIEEAVANGGWFDMMAQELGRTGQVQSTYRRWPLDPLSFVLAQLARLAMLGLAALDGPRDARRSAALQTFGWHIRARRPV
ncbi:MAG: class I SAM-dependent methyltransferase, partial [Gemmobacter sp.]